MSFDAVFPAFIVLSFVGAVIAAIVSLYKQNKEQRRRYGQYAELDNEQRRRYEDSLELQKASLEESRRAHETNLKSIELSRQLHDTNVKGIQLFEESNRLLRELIEEVRHDRTNR